MFGIYKKDSEKEFQALLNWTRKISAAKADAISSVYQKLYDKEDTLFINNYYATKLYHYALHRFIDDCKNSGEKVSKADAYKFDRLTRHLFRLEQFDPTADVYICGMTKKYRIKHLPNRTGRFKEDIMYVSPYTFKSGRRYMRVTNTENMADPQAVEYFVNELGQVCTANSKETSYEGIDWDNKTVIFMNSLFEKKEGNETTVFRTTRSRHKLHALSDLMCLELKKPIEIIENEQSKKISENEIKPTEIVERKR